MQCPKCNSENYKKAGKTKLGFQRYQCKDCNKCWNSGNLKGRQPKGLVAMTDAERARAYRARKKAKQNS